MILRTILHTDPVAISYYFGCVGCRAAAVVDPVGDVEPYLELAEGLGAPIRYVVDTHVHADHESSGRLLAEAAGAQYVLHASADVTYPYHAVADNDELALGNVSARVIHTPGHTPEHVSLLVTDRTRAEDPWLLFTGHTLMVGDMGRTELAGDAEAGARDLFRTASRLRSLPDDLLVLPGAYAGSVCGRGLNGNPMSTLGFEKRHNRALRVENEAEFVDLMISEPPPRPPRAEETRARNAGRPLALSP